LLCRSEKKKKKKKKGKAGKNGRRSNKQGKHPKMIGSSWAGGLACNEKSDSSFFPRIQVTARAMLIRKSLVIWKRPPLLNLQQFPRSRRIIRREEISTNEVYSTRISTSCSSVAIDPFTNDEFRRQMKGFFSHTDIYYSMWVI
jgi:hypothetical protein